MIKIYKHIENSLSQIDEIEENSWINVINPTEDDIENLSKRFPNLPKDFFYDPLDVDEISRLEFEEKDFIVIVRIPVINESNNGLSIDTIPLGIVINVDHSIMTICSRENDLLDSFKNEKIRFFSTFNRDKFVIQIFNKISSIYIKYLKQIKKDSAIIEEEISETMSNSDLIKLFNLEKILIHFRASLKSNYNVTLKLQMTGLFKIDKGGMDLLEDVLIDNKQALEMAEIYSNILNEMMDFFSSLIANNLNVVMKFLTGVTIIIAIPTLIASIYGMNVELPFQNSPYAFMMTMAAAVISAISGVLLFVYRKWM